MGLALARIAARRLPARRLAPLERIGTRLLYQAIPGLRAALLDNAARLAGPGSTIAERRRLAQATLANFARFALGVLAPSSPGEDPAIEVVGEPHFREAKAAGRGVLGVSLHMGNYEAAPAALARVIEPVAILYQTDPSGVFERARSALRTRWGVEEIALDRSPWFAVRVRAVLRRGGMVLVAGDFGHPPRPGEPRRVVPFLGDPAPFPLWPVRLSVASGAPILPCCLVRVPGAGLRLEVDPPIFPEPGDDPERIHDRLVGFLEAALRRHPDQWLIVHRYWDPGACRIPAKGRGER